MVQVEIQKCKKGFKSLKMTGHANYNPGNDIVCSAISCLGLTLVMALEKIRGLRFKKCSTNDGIDLEIEPFEDTRQFEVDTMFKTILTGLCALEKDYPNNINIILLNSRFFNMQYSC